MSTVTLNDLGVVEIAKRTLNGNVVTVSEVLSRYDEWLQDAQWVPCNNIGTHVHTRRLSLPAGSWRKMNYGTAIEVSHTKQIVENVGRLEAWSQIDEMVVQSLMGDRQKFMSTEELAFVMGLGQTLSTAFVDSTTSAAPEKFDGIRFRVNTLRSGTSNPYCLGCGGSGSDTTSVFFIQWGPDRLHMIYQPDVGGASEGAPVKIIPKGLETIQDTAGYPFSAYRTQFVVTAGIAVHDARCLARLTNIEDDVSGANVFEPDLAVELLNAMMERGRGAYMYCHQKVLSQLDVMAMDKVNALYTSDNLWGEPVTYFNRRVPVRQLDAIGITETVVA
jgi:hypothetical protein